MQYQPINTAILSYGMSGEIFHAPLIDAHPGFHLSKILERSKDRARHQYPHAGIVRSFDEILADDTIELVVVNTPQDSHYDLTSKVLESGRHAIVEKPFVITSLDGHALARQAREHGKMLSVFQNRRWDGDFMTVRQVLQSGMLGPLAEFEAHYDRYRPQVDHNTWKEGQAAGSGILYNLGSHMIDQVLDLFGMPESLTAAVGVQRMGGTSPDYYDIRMKYPTHTAIVKSSYLVRDPGPRYVAYGMNGTFTKHGLDPQEEALKTGGIPGAPGWGKEGSEWWGKIDTQVNGLHIVGAVETLPGNYSAYYDNIYAAIRNGEPLAVSAEQATDVIRIIEMACQSSEEGRTLLVE